MLAGRGKELRLSLYDSYILHSTGSQLELQIEFPNRSKVVHHVGREMEDCRRLMLTILDDVLQSQKVFLVPQKVKVTSQTPSILWAYPASLGHVASKPGRAGHVFSNPEAPN